MPATLPFTVSMVQGSGGVSEVLLDGSRGEDMIRQKEPPFFSNKAHLPSVQAQKGVLPYQEWK